MSGLPLNGFSLKHTISCLKQEYQFYSPAYAAALLSPFIHRLFHSNFEHHATYKLVRSIFNGFTRNDRLKSTVSKAKAPYWLTPSLLGTLVATLESGSETLPAPTLKSWNEGVKSKEHIDEWMGIVRAAKLEEERFYFPHCVTYILVAFLWARAKDKSELWEFLNSVNEAYGSTQILTSTSNEYKQIWLAARFYEDEMADSDGNFGDVGKMETLIAFHLGESKYRRRLSPFFPPPIFYETPSCPMGCGWRHADCVETSIRGIINILLYDPKTLSFDLRRLNKLRPSQRLYAFYNSPDVTPQTSGMLSLHSRWLETVSGIAGVDYKYPKCDVKAKLANIRIILEALFQSEKYQNWTYWGSRLSTNKTLKVSISTSRDSNEDRIVFKVARRGQVQSFTLHFWEDQHSWLSYPLGPSVFNISPNILREYWSYTKDSPLPFPALAMMASWSPSMDLPRFSELGANRQTLYLLSRERMTPEDSQTIRNILMSVNHFIGNLVTIQN